MFTAENYKTFEKLLISLTQNAAVIVLFTYVLIRTKTFNDVIHQKFNNKNQIALVCFFGAFSIFGTISGVNILGAIANTRDLGPVIAGLLGGPIAGLGAGFIGGIHRYTLGGDTCIPCSISTVLAGLFGGAIFLVMKKKFPGVILSVIIIVAFEIFHLWLNLVTVKPYDKILAIIKTLAFPMLFANAMGMGIFAYMVNNLIRERKMEEDKMLFEGELKVARDIQLGILPKIFPPFPDRPEFDIFAMIFPAREVGGDLYDFFFVSKHRLCFTIGDVSGKGVPASLFMAVTKTLLKAHADESLNPSEILSRVNDDLFEENDSMMFVTVFFGIIDFVTGEFIYSNGGHNPPYIIRKNGKVEMLEKTKGRLLGVVKDTPFDNKTVKLNEGDTVFCYTDGVTEAMDINGNLFTEKRLTDILEKTYQSDSKTSSEWVLDAIHEFADKAEQSDDITMLVLKFNSMDSPNLTLQIKNNISEIEKVYNKTSDFLKKSEIDIKIINEINLCIEEITANIIMHGYENITTPQIIKIEMKIIDNTLEIKIKDKAKEFNPLEHPTPDTTLPLEQRKKGGLGVHIVKNIMEEILYKREHDYNILTLKKKIK